MTFKKKDHRLPIHPQKPHIYRWVDHCQWARPSALVQMSRNMVPAMIGCAIDPGFTRMSADWCLFKCHWRQPI